MEGEATIDTSDIVIHIDENLDIKHRQTIINQLSTQAGVVSVSNHQKTPHLLVIMYDHLKVNSRELLDSIKKNGVHAELVGL